MQLLSRNRSSLASWLPLAVLAWAVGDRPAAGQAPPSYTLQVVPWPTGAPYYLGMNDVRAINNTGVISGNCFDQGGYPYPTTWTGLAPALLPTISGGASSGFVLNTNNAGQSVGYSDSPNGQRGTVWTNGVPQNTGTLVDPDTRSWGQDINDSGTAVGFCDAVGFSPSSPLHAWLWRADTGIVDLGSLPAPFTQWSAAYAINNQGKIVGFSQNGTGPGDSRRAFIWEPTAANATTGSMRALEPDDNATLRPHSAVDINDQDQVIGSLRNQTAYIWTPTGGVVSLGVVNNWRGSSRANAINNSGIIAGDDGNNAVAYRWDPVRKWVNLNTLLVNPLNVRLSTARGINDSGQIVALGQIGLDFYCFLLTPSNDPPTPYTGPTDPLAPGDPGYDDGGDEGEGDPTEFSARRTK